ncbi:38.7K [Chrysodeixis includens nucleopolyhedrovirus]|uniref:38.7K n=1 Tax=Chrysodeixis includens nucleopolyhedrovirus TaxID=1207438 RepID=A0A5B8YU27_9ABAC|nr:38.7K [Chrysodeixis includens nucleopolyhedrovirus]QED40641.1 38.7K [Chrysodeixis includens nucleopolyhedrovirus]
MFAFLKNLFNLKNTKVDHVSEKTKIEYETAFSYIFKKKRIVFDDMFCFTVRYMYHEREVWIIAQDFARGISFSDPDNVADVIDSMYTRTVDELIFSNNINRNQKINPAAKPRDICTNKFGMLQILQNVEFLHKPEFTTWLIESVFYELESQFYSTTTNVNTPLDDKLSKVLDALEAIKNTNCELESLRRDIREKFDSLDKKMSVEEVYNNLQDYHQQRTNGRDTVDNVSCLLESHIIPTVEDSLGNNDSERQLCRYETVKFPRDTSKHPRLAVFVKSTEDNCTEICFLAGQSARHKSLKRKYDDMELVYDNVHPNPQLAILCLNEELDMKNLAYKKKNRRKLTVNCSLTTARSFINENL